jgi:hypothetical protein
MIGRTVLQSRISDTMIIRSIGDSDEMNHDNDDVMVSPLHYATLRNDTVVHDNGTLDIK